MLTFLSPLKIIFVVILFCGVFLQSRAQVDDFEQWKQELLEEKNDSTLSINFARIAYYYLNINIDSSLHYSYLCLEKSTLIGYPLGLALGNSVLGVSYASKNYLDSALIALYKALEIFTERKDTLGMADCYGNLSFIYDRTNQFEKAVEFGNLDKELRILKKDTNGLFISLSNLLLFHLNNSDIQSAQEVLLDLEKYLTFFDDQYFDGIYFHSSGLIYFEKQDYTVARREFSKALRSWNSETQLSDWAYSASYIGRCDFYLGNYKEAKLYVDSAINIFQSVGSWVYKYDDYHYMARIDSALGNFESALHWQILYTEKELFRMDNQKLVEISLLQDKFESKLKESENKALADQNEFQELIISRQRIIGVAIIVCLVVLGILAIYLLRVNLIVRQKSELLESQKRQIEEQNERLEKLNEVKSKMISIISHDFRSPLVSVQSTMNILEHMGTTEQTMKQLIPELRSKVDYTAELVDNLLLWASDQLEDTNLNIEEVQLKSLIERKSNYFLEMAKRKGVKIIFEELIDISINTDKVMLQSIYRNLVSNAIKFTPQGGEVRIATFETPDSIVFTITDSGMGMDQETQNAIRNRESMTRTGTNKELGSGLGLLICQDFIKRLQGTFHFDSTLGKGTQFYVQIPKDI